MRKLAVVSISCGIGLLVYGLLSFHAWGGGSPVGGLNIGWDVAYPVSARLEAAIGAVLLAEGCLLWKDDKR